MPRLACGFILLFGIHVIPLQAQPPNPGDYSAEQYEAKVSRGHKVRMRDGVHLSVDITQPATPGRYPAILRHTPYNNKKTGPREAWFAKRGYVMLCSDTRGRFGSEGEWDPFDAKHKTDGYDLVEWIAKQEWCTGKVGMLGASYQGYTQWWTANQAPPSLKAIVPEVAPPDHFYNLPYSQGILLGAIADWGLAMAGGHSPSVKLKYGRFTPESVQELMHTPYVDLVRHRGGRDAPWFDKWIRHNLAAAEYWRAISYQGKENYQLINVPALNVTGWFDGDYPGGPMNYEGMKRYGGSADARRPKLVIGPWSHDFNRKRKLLDIDYGPDAVINWDGYVCRWFDHWLKGIDNGVVNDPPVHVFVMGRNRWRAERDWPLPQTRWTNYYLHSSGKANTLNGDGTLDAKPPGEEPADAYTYDPAQPTLSPVMPSYLEGAADTRPSATRAEVLVYTSPPLGEEIEVTGPIVAKLYAATSARDTDWMVRLADVHPDGYSALLCDGVLRARCRDPQKAGAFTPEKLSTIEPEKVYEYTIEFWRGTANVFAKGHRIRVEISSSYFPFYLRNLNTGADNVGLETASVIARQKVYHSSKYPSHIVLPVIP